MSGWQPIETAPKGGAKILVYRPDACAEWMRVDIAHYDSQKGYANPRPFWNSLTRIWNVSELRKYEPTHWMPLPDPPRGEPPCQLTPWRSERDEAPVPYV